MKISILTFLIILSCEISIAQKDSVLVCKASFKTSKYNNTHAGSGFLLQYKNKVYAITAKHVLFFAKTEQMKTVSFGNELKEWRFYSKRDTLNSLLAGKLVNENKEETIEMPPKGDWLIFEVNSSITKNAVVYKLRDKPLDIGEEVYFLGYPYNCSKPIKVKGSFIGYSKDKNLRLDVPKGTYNGCSGGPVIDAEGELVGIVSMGYYNKKKDLQIFEPASLDYFKSIIK